LIQKSGDNADQKLWDPYFTKDLTKARKPLNARSETIARSGMFRVAFAKHRCLVPPPIHYEWRDNPDGKTPFAVARVEGVPVAFGAIWEERRSPEGEKSQSFATITTDTLLAQNQDRMPVIIERADWDRAECKARMACCSVAFIGTNFMSGCDAASKSAAASAASFFLPFFTKGLTATGAISFA
jgi:hypothetical protein